MVDTLTKNQSLELMQTEIERLRSEINQEIVARRGVEDKLEDACAEIERLRADVVHWREARRMCLSAGDMMKAEIEQLRALLRECCEFLEIGDDDCETAREMTILLKRVREAICE